MEPQSEASKNVCIAAENHQISFHCLRLSKVIRFKIFSAIHKYELGRPYELFWKPIASKAGMKQKFKSWL